MLPLFRWCVEERETLIQMVVEVVDFGESQFVIEELINLTGWYWGECCKGCTHVVCVVGWYVVLSIVGGRCRRNCFVVVCGRGNVVDRICKLDNFIVAFFPLLWVDRGEG